MIRLAIIAILACAVIQPVHGLEPDRVLVAQASSDTAEIAWRLIRDSSDALVLTNYIEQFPNSLFAEDARARLELLNDRGGLIVGGPEPLPAEEIPTGRALVSGIQTALNKVGCNAGTPDGIWGRNSVSALRAFQTHSGVVLVSLEPTLEALRAVEGASGRVCPVVCRVTELLQGGRCVPKTCPSGQRLSAQGTCFTPRQQQRTQQPAPSRRCLVVNGQSYCE